MKHAVNLSCAGLVQLETTITCLTGYFPKNGVIGINAGATGIEAVKGVKARTMHDSTAKEDTKYGTLIDHNIVGTTHQHIYNFRLDMDVDGKTTALCIWTQW